MANVLITGGAGFIGSHTAEALLGKGHNVRVLDVLDKQVHGDDPSPFPSYMSSKVELVRGDVRSMSDVQNALEDIDVIYHFAAQTGVGQSMYELRSYVETNCTGTATVLQAVLERAKPVERFVLASSRAVYGEGTHRCGVHGIMYPQGRRREDMERNRFAVYCPDCGAASESVPTGEQRPLFPRSVYAWTKKHQEDLVQHAVASCGLSAVILRYFNVFGSRQSLENPYTGVVSIFYSRMKNGHPIFLYERGAPSRDFVHISDVVQANLLALESEIDPGSVVNVGSGVEVSISMLARKLAVATGVEAEMEDRGEFRVGDIYSCYADLAGAWHVLGYRPRMTLDRGLAEFVNWADSQRSVDLYDRTVQELSRYNLFGRAASDSDERR